MEEGDGNVQRVCETDEHPREPNEACADADALGHEESPQMHPDLAEGELLARVRGHGATAISSLSCPGHTASLHALQSEGACTSVFVGDVLHGIHDLGIAALTDQELWCLPKLEDSHTADAHDEDESAAGEPDIAPAGVGIPVARLGVGIAGKVGHEGPGEEAGDKLSETPPGCHESEEPLLAGG